jgi:sugar/nucleoside kinase (ribokinase family)
MDRDTHVVTVGHAIVDVLAPSSDELVADFGLHKGTMTLVDDARAERIYASLGPATEVSGGSAANTAACLASLGGSVSFIGKVRDDTLGRVFVHDIRAAGVDFTVAPAPSDPGSEGPGTGRCLIMVTPDAEKTMCTSLGVGAHLAPSDIDPAAIGAARIIYLEGYLIGAGGTDAAVERAVTLARDQGAQVALSLSDPFWAELHRGELSTLLDRVDLLFANEEEARALTGLAGAEDAAAALGQRCATVAVTRGAHGSLVATATGVVSVPAAPVTQVVDTTGAGDSYAAGFLFGVTRGAAPEDCARLGALAAAEVVSHLGARPLQSLASLAGDAGLLR